MSSLYFCYSIKRMPGRRFHERFAAARENIPGLTKYKLAKDSGVSESLIGKIEMGKTVPEEETLKKVSPHLRVPLVALLDWAQEERERRAFGDDEADDLQRARDAREGRLAPFNVAAGEGTRQFDVGRREYDEVDAPFQEDE